MHHIQAWAGAYNPKELKKENQVFRVHLSKANNNKKVKTDNKESYQGAGEESNKPCDLTTYQPERFEEGCLVPFQICHQCVRYIPLYFETLR